jgi:hypothetical protein
MIDVTLRIAGASAELAFTRLIGPLFATRPDFYGKATWTMDVKVKVDSTREPYALVFCRANERAILDTLYEGVTADKIMADLKALPAADAAFGPNRWNELVNVLNLDPDHGFHQFTPGGFRFPIPDNDSYAIPETIPVPGQSVPGGPMIKPFDGNHRPGDPSVLISLQGKPVTMLDVVKRAIEGAFLPLTESPVIYQFIKTGTQTSSKKPVVRNSNDDLLPFTSTAFDPSPMAVKYVNPGGDTLVRFTDYKLDGAAKNIYFYYAVEMNDQMKLSPGSPIAGPMGSSGGSVVVIFRACRTTGVVRLDSIVSVVLRERAARKVCFVLCVGPGKMVVWSNTPTWAFNRPRIKPVRNRLWLTDRSNFL